MIRSLTCALIMAAPLASADVPTRLEEAFVTWASEARVTSAQMAIWQNGAPHSLVALKGDADTPVELASLSKAITGLCAASLMEQGVWSADTTSLSVLGYGPDGISVSALLTHRSGLAPDQTQLLMQLWLDTAEDRAELAAQTALLRSMQAAEPGQFTYNNENYAILGAMIAAQTDEPYAAFCQRQVLDPAGVTTARPSPRSGGFAAFGGWQMSVDDYARLMHWGFGPEGLIGKAPQDWPQADIGGGAFYGVGMMHRASRGAMNYWHVGALCFPRRLNIGSYAVRWREEWSVVVAYDACVDQDSLARLDGALVRAVFP